MKYRFSAALLAPPALCILLAACSASTEVSLTGYTPTQYSHVWVTVSEVWLNVSGTAGPDDSGWKKFPLSTPSTVDLVALNNGNLGELASGLNIEAATYSQVRLIPVDPTATLAASALAAGALYNCEADYVDSSGTTHQLPLELLNPDKGIGIPTSLKVPVPGISKSALSGTSTTSTTTGTTTIGGTTTGTTGTTTTGTGVGGTSSTKATPNFYTTTMDGTTDLVAFTASKSPAILLSQHAAAYDQSVSGAISGTLTLTNITTGTSGLPAIQVNAETLSADGTRHVVVTSTSVGSDGTFTLYPLTTNTSTTNPQTYDVVIHGQGIATIIIKSVQVPRPTASTLPTATTTTGTGTTGTGTTGTGTTGTGTTGTGTSNTSTTTAPTVTPVSIGTFTPRAATPYTVTVSTAASNPLPSGATVGFYQTIARAGEVPYLIERAALDPFNQVLFTPQTLSPGTIDEGTWNTNGGAIAVVGAAPAENIGTVTNPIPGYAVAAFAPGYNGGSLTTVVGPPPTGTAAQNVVLAGLTLASGTSSGSVAASVTLSSPGKYDSGELMLSNNGTLVASTPLNAVLKQGGGTVNLTNVPAGAPSALYYVTVRAWNSADPDPTQALRQWYPTAVDLRGSTSGSIQLTIN